MLGDPRTPEGIPWGDYLGGIPWGDPPGGTPLGDPLGDSLEGSLGVPRVTPRATLGGSPWVTPGLVEGDGP